MTQDSNFAKWMREAAESVLAPAGLAQHEIDFALAEASRLITGDIVARWIQAADRGEIRPHALPPLLHAVAHVLQRLIESNTNRTPASTAPVRQPKDRIWHIHTKLAGVSHENPDGTPRQAIIAKLHPRELLVLRHDPDNPYDPNAMMVCRKSNEQIGYLNRELAAEVARRLREGCRYAVFVSSLTGGTPHLPTRGVNVLIIGCAPDTSLDEVQSYVDGIH